MANVMVRRIGVISSAKIQAVISAVIGIFIGLMYGFMIILIGSIPAMANPGGRPAFPVEMSIGLGIGVMVGTPIMAGIAGFIAGALNAFVYNAAASVFGGMEMECSRSISFRF